MTSEMGQHVHLPCLTVLPLLQARHAFETNPMSKTLFLSGDATNMGSHGDPACTGPIGDHLEIKYV